jgi:hypothetical protein
MKIVIDNRRRETYSDRLSIVGNNRPITRHNSCKNESINLKRELEQ